MNIQPACTYKYSELLDKFPEEYQEKLRIYTLEELFYAYKLCSYKPKTPYTSSDVLMLAIKAKLFRWLKGQERYPIQPMAWEKLGKRFRSEFDWFLNEVA